MAKKQNIESASVFERSGIRAIRVRAIDIRLFMIHGSHHNDSFTRAYDMLTSEHSKTVIYCKRLLRSYLLCRPKGHAVFFLIDQKHTTLE